MYCQYSFNTEPGKVRKSWGECFGCVPAGKKINKQESDEYAFHYCCNVTTGLMRSLESWASHFLFFCITNTLSCTGNPLWSCPQTHPLGWMVLLMFQTTEHYSEPFIWFPCKHNGVLWWQHFCCFHILHGKKKKQTNYYFAFHRFLESQRGIKQSWSLTSGKPKSSPSFAPCICRLVTQSFLLQSLRTQTRQNKR